MIADRRRAAVLTLLGLVVGALVLPLVPVDLATIRLGPWSLAWWYAAAAPVVAAIVAVAVLRWGPRHDPQTPDARSAAGNPRRSPDSRRS